MTLKENLFKMVSPEGKHNNHSPYFICVHRNLIILSIDEGGSQLLGYTSPDELCGTSIFSFLMNENWDFATERVKLLEKGRDLSPSIMRFSINGNPIDLKVESENIVFNGVSAVKTILRFITPVHWNTLMDQDDSPFSLDSNKGIVITSPDGTILSASESFTRLTGFTNEDVMGNNPRMWKSRSYTATFYEKMWNSILTKGCWHGELWNKRQDGSHYLMKVNIYSILDKDGALTNYIAIYTDLTEVEKLSHQLKEREEQYRTLVELSPNAIILTVKNRIMYANPPAAALFGMGMPEQLIGMPIDLFLQKHPDIDHRISNTNHSSLTFEDQLEKNGVHIDIEVSSSFITYQGKNAELTVIKEITKRKKIEKELRESEEQYRFIAENSSDMIGRLNGDGEILYISPSCQRMLGFSPEEMIGKNIYEQVHPEDLANLLKEYGEPNEFPGIATFSYRMLHKNGEFIWTETAIRTVKNKSGKACGMMFAARDITARRKIEMQLRESNLLLKKMSSLDGLTEIYNRRAFDEFLQNEWTFAASHLSPLSLMMIDIDYFKKYNDTYGHLQGDECLKLAARSLESFFQSKGYFPARFGGEEFAVILSNTDSFKAYQLAEEFRNLILSMKLENKNSKVNEYVTVSIGVSSLCPGKDRDLINILEFADRALYKAKQNGRNRTELCRNG